MSFDSKIMLPEIMAPVSVSPCGISLTLRLAAVTKNPVRHAVPAEIAGTQSATFK
jgi:hypothetical protein